jgi:hypothetical protein
MSGSGPLSLEIEKLARAAREGNAALVLECSRNISDITNRFTKDVRNAAKGCGNINHKNK